MRRLLVYLGFFCGAFPLIAMPHTHTAPVDTGYRVVASRHLHSASLHREVKFDVFLPPSYGTGPQRYPLLLLHDGQEAEGVRLRATLTALTAAGHMREVVAVGVYAGHNRLQEYGVAAQPDYAGRGARAGAHADFLLNELLPYLSMHYALDSSRHNHVVAGFSLGGLSAFDLAWHHPGVFGKVGVFSGSFWWRSKAYEKGYADTDRIMHRLVRQGGHRPGLRFWLQAGTRDETDDRNGNGIIDAIDDTLDLISELARHGYRPWDDIHYHQMEGGQHNPATWAEAMPVFLMWAFGTR